MFFRRHECSPWQSMVAILAILYFACIFMMLSRSLGTQKTPSLA